MKSVFKIVFSVLITIVCALSVVTAELAFADDTPKTATVTEFSASSDYMPVNAPEQVAVSSTYIVARDGENFCVYANGYTFVMSAPINAEIDELYVVENFLVVFHSLDQNKKAFHLYDLSERKECDATTFEILDRSLDSYPDYPFSITFDTQNKKMYALYDSGCYVFDYMISNGIFSLASNVSAAVVKPYKAARAGAIEIAYLNGALYFLQYNINDYTIAKYVIGGASDQTEIFRTVTIDMTNSIVELHSGGRYVMVVARNESETYFQIFDVLSTNGFSDLSHTITGLCLGNDMIYASEASMSRIIKFSYSANSDKKLVETGIMAYKGDADYLLNEPTAAVEENGEIYVADNQNARIVCYKVDENNKVSATTLYPLSYNAQPLYPIHLAKWKDNVYFTTRENSYILNLTNKSINPLAIDSAAFVSMSSYKNKLYLSTDKDVYTYENARLTKIFSAASNETVYAAMASISGNSVFVTTDKAVYYLNSDKNQTISPIAIESGVTPYGTLSDAVGNAYFFFKKNDKKYIGVYARRLDGYVNALTVETDCKCVNNDLFFVSLGTNGKFYATVKAENRLEIIDISNYKIPEVTEPEEPTEIIKVEETNILYAPAGTKVYSAYNNYDVFYEIAKDQLVVTVARFDYDGYKWYEIVSANNTHSFVCSDALSIVADTEKVFPVGTPKLGSITIYSLPVADDNFKLLTVEGVEQQIYVMNSVGRYDEYLDLAMSRVKYGNVIGYCKTSRLLEYIEPRENIEKEHVTTAVRVNTGSFNVKLPVYAEIGGEVVAELKDNTVVSIEETTLDKSTRYTKINYGTGEGYVETEYLIDRGLTDMTIKLIIFFTIMLIMAILIPVVIKFTRK